MENETRPLIVLGVTGSIAAYKAADLTSQMVKRGWEVHVVMTHGAQEFVAPLTFQTLSRNPVVTSVFEEAHGWKPGHIDLADRAKLLLIAPATANILAELAHGLASNPITRNRARHDRAGADRAGDEWQDVAASPRRGTTWKFCADAESISSARKKWDARVRLRRGRAALYGGGNSRSRGHAAAMIRASLGARLMKELSRRKA